MLHDACRISETVGRFGCEKHPLDRFLARRRIARNRYRASRSATDALWLGKLS
jgi:hypothetical protein